MTQNLEEWILQYRKHRDLVFRKIASIEGKNPILIRNKDETTEQIYVQSSCSTFEKYNKETTPTIIVVLNTEANIQAMLHEWDILAKNKYLSVMFVNPDAQGEKRWIIRPYTHNRISERAALKTGIMSIAEQVEKC